MRARPTQVLPYLLAFALGIGAAGLTACGGENKAMIPATDADGLKADLDAVLSAIDSRDCSAADKAVAQVRTDLLELPSGTSKRLRQKLEAGIDTLERQSKEECEEETTETATTETTTVPTTTTAVPLPTTTETTPVETTPVETTPVETTPTETGEIEPLPPEETGGAPTP